MAARFDDAIKQQQKRDRADLDEKAAAAAKRQRNADMRLLLKEISDMKKAYDAAVTEISTLKWEKEARAKTIALMAQTNADLRHAVGGYECVEKRHQLTERKRARSPTDSD